MRRLPFLVASLPLLAVLAGCQDPLTEVVIVFQSDIVVPAEADSIQTAVAAITPSSNPRNSASRQRRRRACSICPGVNGRLSPGGSAESR